MFVYAWAASAVMINVAVGRSDDCLSWLVEGIQGGREVLGLGKDIVRVVGRDNENAYDLVRQNGGDRRQDADERKIENALDSEGPPAVTAIKGLAGNHVSWTDQWSLLVGSSCKKVRWVQINLCVISNLANSQFRFYGLDTYALHLPCRWAAILGRMVYVF